MFRCGHGISQVDKSHSTLLLSDASNNVGMLKSRFAARRLHILTSIHEASMWTHHHSHSTFLQLADSHQRPGHVRSVARLE